MTLRTGAGPLGGAAGTALEPGLAVQTPGAGPGDQPPKYALPSCPIDRQARATPAR
jgi:hypothetical protein